MLLQNFGLVSGLLHRPDDLPSDRSDVTVNILSGVLKSIDQLSAGTILFSASPMRATHPPHLALVLNLAVFISSSFYILFETNCRGIHFHGHHPVVIRSGRNGRVKQMVQRRKPELRTFNPESIRSVGDDREFFPRPVPAERPLHNRAPTAHTSPYKAFYRQYPGSRAAPSGVRSRNSAATVSPASKCPLTAGIPARNVPKHPNATAVAPNRDEGKTAPPAQGSRRASALRSR